MSQIPESEGGREWDWSKFRKRAWPKSRNQAGSGYPDSRHGQGDPHPESGSSQDNKNPKSRREIQISKVDVAKKVPKMGVMPKSRKWVVRSCPKFRKWACRKSPQIVRGVKVLKVSAPSGYNSKTRRGVNMPRVGVTKMGKFPRVGVAPQSQKWVLRGGQNPEIGRGAENPKVGAQKVLSASKWAWPGYRKNPGSRRGPISQKWSVARKSWAGPG